MVAIAMNNSMHAWPWHHRCAIKSQLMVTLMTIIIYRLKLSCMQYVLHSKIVHYKNIINSRIIASCYALVYRILTSYSALAYNGSKFVMLQSMQCLFRSSMVLSACIHVAIPRIHAKQIDILIMITEKVNIVSLNYH